jgi:DNA-binding FadR family transcriptional regulator
MSRSQGIPARSFACLTAAREVPSNRHRTRSSSGNSNEPRYATGSPVRDNVDTELHRRVAEIAGLRLAGAFMGWVGAVLQPLLHELVAPAVVDAVVVEQHRDVVRAIERGDPVAAERAMREHLVYLSDVVAAVRRSGER